VRGGEEERRGQKRRRRREKRAMGMEKGEDLSKETRRRHRMWRTRFRLSVVSNWRAEVDERIAVFLLYIAPLAVS
jgi:hypothetical protein